MQHGGTLAQQTAHPLTLAIHLAAQTRASVVGSCQQDTPAARARPHHLPLGNRTTLLYFLGGVPKMWRMNNTLMASNGQYSGCARQVAAPVNLTLPTATFMHLGTELLIRCRLL